MISLALILASADLDAGFAFNGRWACQSPFQDGQGSFVAQIEGFNEDRLVTITASSGLMLTNGVARTSVPVFVFESDGVREKKPEMFAQFSQDFDLIVQTGSISLSLLWMKTDKPLYINMTFYPAGGEPSRLLDGVECSRERPADG